jgi:D-3-phosphoglycerate dehydrogenase
MDVIGFDPFISVDTAWNLSRNVKRAFSIEQLYSASDYITVHVPYTDDTKEMFNKSVFEILKPGVHLFNFSRGELVNEIDLEVAIEKGTVRTYVTDFPNEHVLKMENTVSIPHLGASTIESEENCALMAVKQVREFLETGNIKNSINFPNANLPYTGKFRVTVFHLNVPNMVSKITNILSTYSLNIADMMNRSKGNFAYTMIDIDSDIENAKKSELDEQLNKIDGIIKVRFI